MRFQVPPKTFRLVSWITELDHATNLVVSSKPPDRRLGKPECQKCCNETANIKFAIDSHVDSLQYHRLYPIHSSRFTSRLLIISFVNSNLLAIEPLGAYLRLRHYEMNENLNCSEFHPIASRLIMLQ